MIELILRFFLRPKPGGDSFYWCGAHFPIKDSVTPLQCSKAVGHAGPHTAFLGGTGSPLYSWEDHTRWAK